MYHRELNKSNLNTSAFTFSPEVIIRSLSKRRSPRRRPLPRSLKMDCPEKNCNGFAVAGPGMVWKAGGVREIHFTCSDGHTFHTDGAMVNYFSCDCTS